MENNYKLKELNEKLDSLKAELIQVGLQIGLSHPITVSLSQQLDIVILELQKEQNKLNKK
ncbi:Spo0E family sporulation regulatory protein-aspartic acid phosphatase (plasmid) [Metabacillus halosaccharovorans]|uniref:aspartyl-phosphate phosphatase Spo0E family protein n=1 Tax=Metabacillus halosaccharovorans TaxID=930124 RepID=UPI001C1F2E7D|nr:aspartyl-phosphate phosphatase Spo0E family protein [Metabacillus halosaccharovorans]MBU7595849.1 Spo0E family sporulation regulatory protein-aspartic acid phosphatase [Metabacillus halosaccharovorans]MCM3441426.1 aspartyl-phosphate phosphatase Spo0E family protein [Metabacillus halosaccharovorans]